MKKNSYLLIIGFVVLFTSCKSHECYNNNIIFAKYGPQSKKYRDELATEINQYKAEQLSYYLLGYKKSNDKEYIEVSVQASNLCAKSWVLVEQWDEVIEGIKQNKGKGYIGAELVGLKLKFIETPNGIQLKYKSVESMVD
jgi:hypothetical protein